MSTEFRRHPILNPSLNYRTSSSSCVEGERIEEALYIKLIIILYCKTSSSSCLEDERKEEGFEKIMNPLYDTGHTPANARRLVDVGGPEIILHPNIISHEKMEVVLDIILIILLYF